MLYHYYKRNIHAVQMH